MKHKSRNGFLLLMMTALLGIGGCQMANGQKMTVQEMVDFHYVNDDGVIHAYPDDESSEYLSESIGLYMQYLLQVDDRKSFQQQVDILTERFLVEENGHRFIPWRLYEEANVNALIDDVRIAAVLRKASEQFNEPDYLELGEQLMSSIQNRQQNDGIVADYYDWSYGMAGNRLTLSYLISDLPVHKKSFNMLEVEKGQVFFPEYYDFDQKRYVESEEVHMIDQLLIAINRHDQGLASPEFDEWLLKEWENQGMLAGRYTRKTGASSVDYESLAVYYYLWQYFEITGMPDLAEEAAQRAGMVAGEEVPGELHFFDFIQYQMMMAEQ